jgi:hypothetical protein
MHNRTMPINSYPGKFGESMRETIEPVPTRIPSLPPEAGPDEVADFARGVATLDRLAKRVAEFLRARNGEGGQ